MALSEIDRQLLDRCLAHKPRAWEDFVDRFMGLVVHVANHSAQARSVRLGPEDREDLCASVFLAVIKDDFAVLRHFRGQSSLATYLTVVARRVIVREMLHNSRGGGRLAEPVAAAAHAGAHLVVAQNVTAQHSTADHANGGTAMEQRVSNRDEVERLLEELDGNEAEVVRMYHLEGKSYQEISAFVGIAENSVGPTLSRAREKMRQAGLDRPVS